jgi:diaminohydroxyphosphoribosylaminopyrimidine deaminase/5-amino-6-(5-phosphoribosylamino)uracil reductase
MTLDGKIATTTGQSKWITSPKARAFGRRLRQGADAILVGINTVLADDPHLTVRVPVSGSGTGTERARPTPRTGSIRVTEPRRIIVDSLARTPLSAHVVTDDLRGLTTVFVTSKASFPRVKALAGKVNVVEAPLDGDGKVDLAWLIGELGREEVTELLVEGGGEVNGRFLFGGFAHRVAFFYAPIIVGGRNARKAVGGIGAQSAEQVLKLDDIRWRRFGPDLLLTARVRPNQT